MAKGLNLESWIFDYKLKFNMLDSLVLILGDSGTGKTLLYNYFKDISFENKSIKCFDSTNCKSILSKLQKLSGCAIVIDNCDIILSNKTREFIGNDTRNIYVLMGRNGYGLWINENRAAEIVRDDIKKTISLDYIFKTALGS